MKKMSDLMEDLGFRQESSFEVKKAFIKNLIREAQNQSPKPQDDKRVKTPSPQSPSKEQLSFFDHKKTG